MRRGGGDELPPNRYHDPLAPPPPDDPPLNPPKLDPPLNPPKLEPLPEYVLPPAENEAPEDMVFGIIFLP